MTQFDLTRKLNLKFNRLIHKGFRRDLTREDMWEIDYSETSELITNKLEYEWNRLVLMYFIF